MNIFGELFDKGKQSPPISWVKFDNGDFQLLVDEPSKIFWKNPSGIVQLIQYEGRADWLFDLDDMDAARLFYGDQCISFGGVMLCLDKTTISGVDILHGIFKYRAVDMGMAMHFIGIIWIPFEDRIWQLNIESIEHGTTGLREALVFNMHPELEREVRQIPEEISSKFTCQEDVHAYIKAQPLHVLASDEERFDSIVEVHPLTLVRRRLRRVLETMEFAPEVPQLKKFKVQNM